MAPAPGWVYVLTCPDFPGCVKIGGTGRTATHRAGELVGEYGTASPFRVRHRFPVSDWPAVELAAHRMLSDRRLPRSELFRCGRWQACRTIKAAARAFDRPGLLRRFLLPRPVLTPSRPRYGRRGTNWLPVLVGLVTAAVLVHLVRPMPATWWPPALAHTVLLLERL